MKQLLIIMAMVFMYGNKMKAQNIQLSEAKAYISVIQNKTDIPVAFQLQSAKRVCVDGLPAILVRYEKLENNGAGGEHFSFVISEREKQILGFIKLDKKYSNLNMLSSSETEKIAKDFLIKIDGNLAKDLENLWVQRHDEEIIVNGKPAIVAGMKYKCYRRSKNDYAWVIVGFDGSVITFERNIKWNNTEHKRITEKWLHDNWLAENKLTLPDEERVLTNLVEETFANGALNKLNTEEMQRGFHPDFAILIAKDSDLFRLPLHDWMKIVKEYKSNPAKVSSGIRELEYTINVMGITETTAIVRTQFFREKKLIITDYLSYIKYSDGWKAVAKVSNDHIIDPLHLNLNP